MYEKWTYGLFRVQTQMNLLVAHKHRNKCKEKLNESFSQLPF